VNLATELVGESFGLFAADDTERALVDASEDLMVGIEPASRDSGEGWGAWHGAGHGEIDTAGWRLGPSDECAAARAGDLGVDLSKGRTRVPWNGPPIPAAVRGPDAQIVDARSRERHTIAVNGTRSSSSMTWTGRSSSSDNWHQEEFRSRHRAVVMPRFGSIGTVSASGSKPRHALARC